MKVELRVEQIFQICESKDKLGVAVLLVPRESHSYITIVLSRPVYVCESMTIYGVFTR